MTSSISNTDQQILLATSAIINYVGGVMFVFGTVGNLMNMVVFCCLKSYRSLATSAFLATTAFTSQLFLTFTTGLGSLSEWISYDIPSSNSAICKSTLYFKTVSIEISLTCLCLASIDRYLMTSRSVGRRELITLKRARLLICACVVVWMCVQIPYALYSNNVDLYKLCLPSLNYSTTATYLNLFLSIILPINILSVFGLLTWKNLGNTRLTALNAQVTKMTLLDIIVVALSNIPLGSFYIYLIPINWNRPLTSTESLMFTLAQLISSAQASGSFYFYLLVSSAFRTNVKNMLCSVLCFWKPRRTHQIAPSAVTALAIQTKMPTAVV